MKKIIMLLGILLISSIAFANDNQFQTTTSEFRFAISGLNGSIGNAFESVVPQGGSVSTVIATTTMQISSSSANDTAAGTGVRTVSVSALNGSYQIFTETVTMAGTGGVNMVTDAIAINSIEPLTVGTGLTAAGDIYAGRDPDGVTGTPTTIYGLMQVGTDKMQTSLQTAPDAGGAYIQGIRIDLSDTGRVADVRLRKRNTAGLWMVILEWIESSDSNIQSDDIQEILPVYLPAQNAFDLQVRVRTGAATTVTSFMTGVFNAFN